MRTREHCGYNVVGQILADVFTCSECGGILPDLRGHNHPLIVWKLVQDHPELARSTHRVLD